MEFSKISALRHLRLLGWGGWSAALMFTAYQIYGYQRVSSGRASTAEIASILDRNGDVSYRKASDFDWISAREINGLYENELFSTGADGGARLELGKGRYLDLEANTVIKMDPPKTLGGSTEIFLIAGSVKVDIAEATAAFDSAKSGSPGRVAIIAGGSRFEVAGKGSALHLEKPRDSTAVSVKSASGSVQNVVGDQRVPVTKARSFAVEAAGRDRARVLDIPANLATSPSIVAKFAVETVAIKPQPLPDASTLLDVDEAKPTERPVAVAAVGTEPNSGAGSPASAEQVAPLAGAQAGEGLSPASEAPSQPAAAAGALAAPEAAGPATEQVAVAGPPVAVGPTDKDPAVVAPLPAADDGTKSLAAAVSEPKMAEPAKPFAAVTPSPKAAKPGKQPLTAAVAPSPASKQSAKSSGKPQLKVIVGSTTDASLAQRQVGKSAGFAVEPGKLAQLMNGAGVFVVRKHEIVAALAGDGWGVAQLAQVRRALSGSLIFRGNGQLLLRRQDLDSFAKLDKKGLYLAHGHRLVPISEDIASSFSDLGAMAATSGVAIFRGKVELIGP